MKKAIRYSIAVCLFSWAMFAAAHWGFGMGTDTPKGLMAFSTVYMFFPLITALVLQAIDKEKFNHTGLVNFKVSWSWVVAWQGWNYSTIPSSLSASIMCQRSNRRWCASSWERFQPTFL